jgi:outer membrane lipoprotein-sorting protein
VNPYIHPLLALLFSLVYSTVLAATDDTMALNKILQKHLEAMGGLSNWQKVESIQLNGTIERDNQTVDIVIVKKRPNQIRATVTVPIPGKKDAFLQIIQAHNGKTAWSAKRRSGTAEMIQEELDKEAADNLLADSGVMPRLIKFWRNGAKLKHMTPEKTNDSKTFIIQATPPNSSSIYTFYISKENYLVTEYETTHPKHGVTRTRLSNYQMEQGVMIPTLNIIQSEQTGKSVLTTHAIKIGVGIYEEYFELNKRAYTAKR